MINIELDPSPDGVLTKRGAKEILAQAKIMAERGRNFTDVEQRDSRLFKALDVLGIDTVGPFHRVFRTFEYVTPGGKRKEIVKPVFERRKERG